MVSTARCSSVVNPYKVFTREEVRQFVDEGWVLLRNAFPADAAAEVRDIVWKKTGKDPNDRNTWDQKQVHICETLRGPEIDRCYSRRVCDAFDDLTGEGRWVNPGGLGWWPVIFPGFDKGPWQAPKVGWHVDGSNFHHRLNSPEQGLLAIFIFSDVGPGDAGTAFDLYSHKIAARELAAAEPAGLSPREICQAVNRHGQHHVRQIIANAGDIAILHPFMNHAPSDNVGDRVRFMCNAQIPLREPMKFDRGPGDPQSPVELAIIEALQQTAAR